MADLPSTLGPKVNTDETAADSPVTSALTQKLGSLVNGLLDANTSQDTTLASHATSLASQQSQIDTLASFAVRVANLGSWFGTWTTPNGKAILLVFRGTGVTHYGSTNTITFASPAQITSVLYLG